jgi:DNA invertase Pin-like site-specific DNA recombinase
MPRRFNKPGNNQEQQPNYSPRPWNLLVEVAIYARQSTTKQTVENKENSEAQTKDQLEKVSAIGWSDDNITLFIEGDGKRGVSGRLRIDKRAGLNALMEGIYAGRFKYVFVTNEGRLFRDETMIGPDTFIDACKTHDVIVVTDMYRYDFKGNPFASDQFRIMCQMAARFITDHVGMMLRMRDRVAMRDQYFGGRVPIGYILDEHKRFIPYEPHARIVRWIFKRFRQVNNVAQVARELNAKGYAFPAYEAGIKAPYTNLSVSNGGYSLTKMGVFTILTNPQYIGYFVFKKQVLRDSDGKPKKNHPAIVDEDDFWYAFNKLNPTMLDGELNEEREGVTRFEQEGTVPPKALLKYVIGTPNGKVYLAKEYKRKVGGYPEQYDILIDAPDYVTNRHGGRVDVSLLDSVFVARMFEHLIAWKNAEEEEEEDATRIGKAINEKIDEEKSTEPEEKPTVVIDKQLEKLRPKIVHYKRLVDNGYDLEEEDLKGYTAELAKLRRTEKELKAAKESIEKELSEQAESQELLDETLEMWNTFRLDQKHRVIRLIVDHVTLYKVAPSWARVEIIWKGIGTTSADIGYLRLNAASNRVWTDAETATLREMYSEKPADEMLEALPDRSWKAIIQYAHRKGIRRNIFNSPTDPLAQIISTSDRKFMKQYRIVPQESARGAIYWRHIDQFLPYTDGEALDVDVDISDLNLEAEIDIEGLEIDELKLIGVNDLTTSDKDRGMSSS